MTEIEVGSKWTNSGATAKVLLVHNAGEVTWVTYERNGVSGRADRVRTLPKGSFIGFYSPEPTFFEVGKGYFLNGGEERYDIKFVTNLIPLDYGNIRSEAYAVATTPDGKQFSLVLTMWDFKRSVLIQD